MIPAVLPPPVPVEAPSSTPETGSDDFDRAIGDAMSALAGPNAGPSGDDGARIGDDAAQAAEDDTDATTSTDGDASAAVAVTAPAAPTLDPGQTGWAHAEGMVPVAEPEGTEPVAPAGAADGAETTIVVSTPPESAEVDVDADPSDGLADPIGANATEAVPETVDGRVAGEEPDASEDEAPVADGDDDLLADRAESVTEASDEVDADAPPDPDLAGDGPPGSSRGRPADRTDVGREDRPDGRAVADLARSMRAESDASGDRAGPARGAEPRTTDATTGSLVSNAVRAEPAAPAAPAGQAGPAGPTAPSGVPDQIVEHVSALVEHGDGTHEVTIDLDPVELGRLRISVSLEDGTISVRVQADDPGTRRLLGGSLEQLRASLEGAGLRTGDLDVDHRAPDRQRRDAPSHQRDGRAESATAPLRHRSARPPLAHADAIDVLL